MGSWKECLDSESAYSVTPDIPKVRSLRKTAQGRLDFLKQFSATKDNANYIFEGYYTSALELLHSVVLQEGFKVLNHICLGFYLRDKLQRADLYRIFNDARYKRNGLTYYGNRMDFATARDAIENCERLITALEEMLNSRQL